MPRGAARRLGERPATGSTTLLASTKQGVSKAVVGIVARTLRELGAHTRHDLEESDARYVDGRIADAMLDDAASALDDDAVGIHIARRIAPGALGLLDYALFTGERWGTAIRRVAHFYAVVSERVTMAVEDDGREACVALTRHPLHRLNRHWIELSLAIVTERARLAIGPEFRLLAVDFQHDAPARDSGHTRYFNAPVRFARPQDKLIFDRAWLDAPLKTGAAVLAEALERKLDELVPAQLHPTMVRVREAVAHGIDSGDLALDSVAGRLGMSARTLQRTLREHDTGFKAEVDTIRRDRAFALLRTNDVSVAEIGRRLGFADPTAFFRAFRRWTGTTPRSRSRTVNAGDDIARQEAGARIQSSRREPPLPSR